MRPRSLWLVSLVALVPTALPAQSRPSPPPVEVDYDKTADFGLYKTYAWVPFQEPAKNPANHIRIMRAVERELEAKGLTKADPPHGADLFIHYQGRVDKQTRSTPTVKDSVWQPSNPTFIVNFDRIEVGTLIVELWDGKSKDMVWKAKGSEMLRRADQTPEQIDAMVTMLLAGYPPKPKPRE